MVSAEGVGPKRAGLDVIIGGRGDDIEVVRPDDLSRYYNTIM
jgi:hypothetical protein